MTEEEYDAMQRLETMRAACRVLVWVRRGDPHAAKAYATLQAGIRKLEKQMRGTIVDTPAPTTE
jgi:hypothetical protein